MDASASLTPFELSRRFTEQLQAIDFSNEVAAQEAIAAMVAQYEERLAALPLRGTYTFAVLGAATERGGVVTTASASARFLDRAFACVGDVVTYADGSTATIVSGAGAASHYLDRPHALIGSHLDNGDRIASNPIEVGMHIREFAAEPIAGLLQPGYSSTLPARP